MSRRTRRPGLTWPKRRQWLDRIACDTRLTAGAKSWLMLLAQRSDDAGKPVILEKHSSDYLIEIVCRKP